MTNSESQFITLDHPDNVAVFTEDGKVFMDLNYLVNAYSQPLIARTMVAIASGDPVLSAEVKGSTEIILHIKDEADRLIMDAL